MKYQFHSALSPEEFMGRLRERTNRGAWAIANNGPTSWRASIFGKHRFYLAMSPWPGWGPNWPVEQLNTSVFRGRIARRDNGSTLICGSFGVPIWIAVFWWGIILGAEFAFLCELLRARLDLLLYIPISIVALGVAGMAAIGLYCLGHFHSGKWETGVLDFIRRELLYQ